MKKLCFLLGLWSLISLCAATDGFRLDVPEPLFLWTDGTHGLITTRNELYAFKISEGRLQLEQKMKSGQGPGELPSRVDSLSVSKNGIVVTAFPSAYTLAADGQVLGQRRLGKRGSALTVVGEVCGGMSYNPDFSLGFFVSDLEGNRSRVIRTVKLGTKDPDKVLPLLFLYPAWNLCAGENGFFLADGENSLAATLYSGEGKVLEAFSWPSPGPEVTEALKNLYKKQYREGVGEQANPEDLSFPRRLPSYRKLFYQSGRLIFKTYHQEAQGTRYYAVIPDQKQSPVLFHLPVEAHSFWLTTESIWFVVEDDEGYFLKQMPVSL